jgi:hypothetical protein
MTIEAIGEIDDAGFLLGIGDDVITEDAVISPLPEGGALFSIYGSTVRPSLIKIISTIVLCHWSMV